MAKALLPIPVKYFVAILYHDPKALQAAKETITHIWGPLDFEGTDHRFDVSDYYQAEMGAPLQRRLIFFETLLPPAEIVDIKLRCNDIEKTLAVDRNRTVNLDAGYMDHNKVILASAKEAGQKIYLDSGIYADIMGRYEKGRYRPFDWTFPDFRDGRYDEEFLAVRRIYLAQRKGVIE